jgi:23S rRNA (uridine2552-2'-O)-methyltransferase
MTDKKKPPPTRTKTTPKNKKIRVKTGKKRTVSSARWLERQLNDPLVREAREQGYRARSVFKIIEMDDKIKAMKPGTVVVDLGATPGSWTQIAVERVKPETTKGRVIAMDILPMDPVPGAEFLQADFTDNDTPEKLIDMLDGRKADVVLSDMAANTTGQRAIDHIRTVYLVELAWDFARQVLAPGGRDDRQSLPGRHREKTAGRAEEELHLRQTRQARGQPQGIARAVRRLHRFPRLDLPAGWRRHHGGPTYLVCCIFDACNIIFAVLELLPDFVDERLNGRQGAGLLVLHCFGHFESCIKRGPI